MKFIIKRAVNKQFFFILKARNGETLVTSETYLTRQSCKKAIRAVKRSLFAKVEDDAHNIIEL